MKNRIHIFAKVIVTATATMFVHLTGTADGQVAAPAFIPGAAQGSVAFNVKVTYATSRALIRYTTNGTGYRYNALGQRSERVELDGTAETAHFYYLYDGIHLLCRYLGTLDGDGKSIPGEIDRRYFEEGEQRKSGTNWASYYYTRDHLGSIREVMNSDGTLAARYDYDPYGKRMVQFESGAYVGGCDLGYTGHIVQPSPVGGQEGIVLTLFRAYDPELGKWLSADPIGEVGGLNLYAYVLGNPLNFVDPEGLSYWDLSGSFFLPTRLVPAGVGFTGGFFIDDCGDVIPYSGVGIGTAGPGVSLMHSNQDPSPGKWSVQITGGIGIGGAYGFDETGSDFVEVGATTPGASVTAYYTYNPWFNIDSISWQGKPSGSDGCK